MAILTLNSGSTSLKFGLYGEAGSTALVAGEATGIGSPNSKLKFADSSDAVAMADVGAALRAIAERLSDDGDHTVTAIGHRIAHGGPNLVTHQRLSPAVMNQLEAATHFAPLHIPASLKLVRAAEARFPNVPEFACFDTAFHQTMPSLAYTYALPLIYRQAGLRRYGFHGLSFESVVHALAEGVPQRMVVAHLGGGSSLCALVDGRSVDTTMGVSPAGGVVMGTRSGDLDPEVVLLLQSRLSPNLPGLSRDGTESLLNHDSGIKALAGEQDMQTLLQRTDEEARFAVDLYCRDIVKAVAAFASVLGGIDLLVFTGGIGEHSDAIRRQIGRGVRFLGDIPVKVVPADEDGQIARHVSVLMRQA